MLALRDGPLGLIVDRVESVRRVPSDRISVTPVPGAEKGFGDQIASIDDELVLLIDPQRVLGSLLRPPSTRTTKTKPAPKRAVKPAAKRAVKPAAKRAVKPAVKRAVKPAVKRAVKPAAKPAAKRQPSTRRPPAA